MTKGTSKYPTPAIAPRAEPTKPRSARDLAGASEATSPASADEQEGVHFETDGVSWTAQSMGGSIGPRGTAPAPLLLIRFTRGRNDGSGQAPPAARPAGPAEDPPAASARDTGEPPGDAQAWVAARSLSDLSIEQLVDALRTARPWTESGGHRPFFGDIGGQRRR